MELGWSLTSLETPCGLVRDGASPDGVDVTPEGLPPRRLREEERVRGRHTRPLPELLRKLGRGLAVHEERRCLQVGTHHRVVLRLGDGELAASHRLGARHLEVDRIPAGVALRPVSTGPADFIPLRAARVTVCRLRLGVQESLVGTQLEGGLLGDRRLGRGDLRRRRGGDGHRLGGHRGWCHADGGDRWRWCRCGRCHRGAGLRVCGDVVTAGRESKREEGGYARPQVLTVLLPRGRHKVIIAFYPSIVNFREVVFTKGKGGHGCGRLTPPVLLADVAELRGWR